MSTPWGYEESEYGHLRVTVDGVDVTFFRDCVTIVAGWQDTDPYSSNNATVLFPQISELENWSLIPWFREGATMRLDHVNNGVVVSNKFDGLIDRIEIEDVVSATCTGNLTGRLGMNMHQPSITRTVRDIGAAIYGVSEAATNGHYDMTPEGGIVTGMLTGVRGDRAMTKLGFTDHLLGQAIRANGDSLTVLADPADRKTYVQQWREMKATPDATVDAGAHGVKPRISRDLVDMVNRVYAEWVTPSGERCRGAVYPNLNAKTVPAYPFTDGRAFGLGTTDAGTDTGSGITIMARELVGNNLLDQTDAIRTTFDDDVVEAVEELQRDSNLTATGQMTPALWAILYEDDFAQQSFRQAHYRPVARDKRTDYFLRGPDGTPYDINPTFDASIPHVETFIGHGEGTTSKQVRRNGRAMINRRDAWAGTITLTSDPAEMSRFDLRAGMTIAVRWLKGSGAAGMKFYVSSVQVDWAAGVPSVTLAVSTTARHYLDLLTRQQRNREARQDPAAQWRHQMRRSAQTSDAISGWEGESGAGIIKPTVLHAGFNKIPMIACEVGVMGDIELTTTSPPTVFTYSVHAAQVEEAVFASRLGDPLVYVNATDEVDVYMANAEWLLEDERIMVEYWGTPAQPCGYWPLPHTNPKGDISAAPITGKHKDPAGFKFASPSCFLWLMVYVPTACTIEGRARIQITEGT